jgi:membrane protease YdiL (CAAX protease family)
MDKGEPTHILWVSQGVFNLWEIVGLILIALMLRLLPPEAYIRPEKPAWAVILIYSGIYLFTVRQSGAGKFIPLDALWMALMYCYMISRPISWPLVKLKDLAEFEVAYRGLYLALFGYFLLVRRIDTGFSFYISGGNWLITLGATATLIILGTLLSGGFQRIFTTWKRIRFQDGIITGIYMFFWVAMSQEIFFRGMIQNFLGQWLGPLAALMLGAIIFGLAHVNYSGPTMILTATGAGLAYGLVYLFTGNVLCAVICHTLTNVYWKQVVGQAKR